MRPYNTCITIAVFMLGLSCSSKSLNSDYDREYDFSTFKKYRWATFKEMNPNDRLTNAPMVYKRIRDGVNASLTASGCTLVEGDDVDFVVLAHAGYSERTQVHSTLTGGYGGWYNPWWGPYGGSTQINRYDEGTLIIDVVHWQKKELAWRGMSASVFDDYSDNTKKLKQIDALVARIMEDYPPGRK